MTTTKTASNTPSASYSAPVAGVHSCVLHPQLKRALAGEQHGKYGRLFHHLPAAGADEAALLALARAGAAMDDTAADPDEIASLHPCVPAGFNFFGQFIAHDITADRSLIQHHASVRKLINFRQPRLDLEPVYGGGPAGSPYFYDRNDPDCFLLGINDAGLPNDLPRNSQGIALIGDARNDVHLFVAQLHVAFLKFHNAVVAYLREQGTPAADIFATAQRLVRWHYQWIATHEFLPLIAGADLVADIVNNGPRIYTAADRSFLPVEFADAAYRYGHSQIRASYQLNDQAQGRVFPECCGSRPVPQAQVIDWRYFFAIDDEHPPQPARRIDTRLVHPLIDLPASVVGEPASAEERSLAVRDLLRGHELRLPSGQAVARAMGVEPLPASAINPTEIQPNWQHETPLWYYVLQEAAVQTDGVRLGAVGGRIVAEVLLGLIAADPGSYVNAEGDWTPTLPAAVAGDFTMADLLRFAGATGASQPRKGA